MQRNTQLDVTRAAAIVAEHSYGAKGLMAYEYFHIFNTRYFNGELPVPHIVWELTAWGRCVGETGLTSIPMPTIRIHPTTRRFIRNGDNELLRRPDGTPVMNLSYALDVLLHEMVHVYVHYVCRHRCKTKTSDAHNNKWWLSKIEEISLDLGYEVQFYNGKTRRVNGEPVRSTPAGHVPYECSYRWPHALRRHMGDLDYYKLHPIECDYNGGWRPDEY